MFLLSMLLAPYASNQGLIVPLALVASWPAVAVQYVVSFALAAAGIYLENSAWWALLFGVSSLWLYSSIASKPPDDGTPARP